MPKKIKSRTNRSQYTVLITASGTSQELGEITKYINKTLIKVGRKPTLSYIIEAYPKNTKYVVTLGHFGEQVREFIKLVYPDRKVTFVEVKPFEGPGSSLGYSMLQAKKHLQRPFIYHASDTIVTEKIPPPTRNWIAGVSGEGSSHYTSFDVQGREVLQFYDKGALSADFLHIGLVGIKDYQAFWKQLQKLYRKNARNAAMGDVEVLQTLLREGHVFSVQPYTTWHDVGNIDALQKARREIADSFHILDKLEESIYFLSGSVVKFFADAKIAQQRVKRANFLKKLVPRIERTGKNFYQYRYVKGDLYADRATPADFRGFLQWAEKNLWRPVHEVSEQEFKTVCRDFYEQKTHDRIQQFLNTRGLADITTTINGVRIPSVKKLLREVDFDWLATTQQTQFHGDFILDNIIKTKSGFSLLDWRQNFGGLLRAGDKYYDLAKLNHNLVVNHDIVNANEFAVTISGSEVECDIRRRERLVECQHELFSFLAEGGYDAKKVTILTPLIWLNMAPLHHHPFDLFLFHFGKYKLWQALRANQTS